VEPIEYYENGSRDALDELVEEPTCEEMSTIITNFRKSKAPGIDNINPELIQAAGPQMNSRIYGLVRNIWTKEKLLNEWNLALICPTYKKWEKSECSNLQRNITSQLCLNPGMRIGFSG
jgi:hypothetical protein